MKELNVIVLGAGCAGLAAAYELKKHNISCEIYEKNEVYGGLCRSFTISGYTFDTFAHVNFSKDEYVMSILEEKTPYIVHSPEAMNYTKGLWIRNPVQNNLIGLPIKERINIIKDFINRNENLQVHNYNDWLLKHYGGYFTENYPAAYTRKYWTVEPDKLEWKWINNRMYTPTLEEILTGAMTKETPNVHYTKEIHYPQKGGYMAFLRFLAQEATIRYNKKMTAIDFNKKIIKFSDDTETTYDKLISTIPLTEVVNAAIDTIPSDIKEAAEQLDYTSGIMVSIGLNCQNISPALWFYIYDEDIYPARVYAPNIKSPQNVPQNCSALQAEIYYSKYKPLSKSLEEIQNDTVEQLIKMGLFTKNNISVLDVRQEQYANIMFTPGIYNARKKVRSYLSEHGIITAGRFGEWEYRWTGDSILSGKNSVLSLL